MGAFAVGQVVTVPFPFTNQAESKVRPAVVVANVNGKDSVLCAITSHSPQQVASIEISDNDFEQGTLRVNPSYILPSKLMTAEDSIIIKAVAKLKEDTINDVLTSIRDIFRN